MTPRGARRKLGSNSHIPIRTLLRLQRTLTKDGIVNPLFPLVCFPSRIMQTIGPPKSSRTRRDTYLHAVQSFGASATVVLRDREAAKYSPSVRGVCFLHLLPPFGDAGLHFASTPCRPWRRIFDYSEIPRRCRKMKSPRPKADGGSG